MASTLPSAKPQEALTEDLPTPYLIASHLREREEPLAGFIIHRRVADPRSAAAIRAIGRAGLPAANAAH